MEITGTPPAGAAGSAYSYTLAGANGASPYTFTHGSLPSGWAVSSGGAITHAGPSSGSYQIPVTMTDSNRQSVAKTYTIVIV